MQKILAFSKIYLLDTLQNKLAFIFNLVFPIVFFVVNNFKLVGKTDIEQSKLISGLSIYFAYIVLVSLLNLVIIPLIAQREQGMLLEYTLISLNKAYPFLGSLILQLGVLLLELLLFDITVYLMFPNIGGMILGLLTLRAMSATLPVMGILSLLLLLKIGQQSVSVIVTLLMLTCFLLLSEKPDIWSLLNPLQYIEQLVKFGFSWGSLFVGVVYLGVGSFSAIKFDVAPKFR